MPPPSNTTRKVAAPQRPASRSSSSSLVVNAAAPSDTLRRKPSAGILTTSTTAAGKRTARIATTATAIASPSSNTTTTTSTTTPAASRHPLRLRDQNATPPSRAVKPAPAPTNPIIASTAARMPPYDRPTVAGHHRQPVVARAVNKPPLTPKIAARQNQPVAATPLPRRPQPDASLSAANAASARDKDDFTSPVSAFLSSNITPRSGSRQSRVDSANSTPNGTPNPDRHDSWEVRSGMGDEPHKRPVVTFSPPSEVGSTVKPERDSKFFYASDAQKQPPQATAARQSTVQQSKPATFFYANGSAVPERPGAPPRPFPPTAPLSASQDSLATKFVYANGAPELQPPAKIGPSISTTTGSVVSTASRLPLTRQATGPRAPSPVKSPQQTAARIPSGSSAVSPRSPISLPSPQSSAYPSQAKVTSEPPTRPTKSHTRTKSATTIEPPVITAKLTPSHSSVPSSGRTSPSNSQHPAAASLPQQSPQLPPANPATSGFASLLQAAEDFADQQPSPPDEAATAATKPSTEPLNSPTKSSSSSQDGSSANGPPTIPDLVASARRERKVQDLEITNASLEAINRTLERQLRKQTAELRRYQRLSRSGRLSLGSLISAGGGNGGSRVASDATTVEGGGLARAGMGLDDLSEEESEEDELDEGLDGFSEEEEEDDDGDDLSGSEADSSNGLGFGMGGSGKSTLRHEKRRREERRLQLDLSKHQQLLVDSQKINQSLKRCLGWTEELIKEGKRALTYQVQVSDVELGGRVLAPEEVERREREHGEGGADGEEAEEGGGEGAAMGDETIYAIDALGRGSLAEDVDQSEGGAVAWGKDAQDRDSGIELPADGG